MYGRPFILWVLLALPHPVLAEGTSDVHWLSFTRDVVSSNALDSDKDSRVQVDPSLGARWRAATALDVAVHFDPARHDVNARFCLAGSPYVWRLTPIEGGAKLYALGPEPPPPPGGVWPSVVIAGIRDDAPIAFTRGRIDPGATDEEKDALACSEIGNSFLAASDVRLQSLRFWVLPPPTEAYVVRTDVRAWRILIRDGRVCPGSEQNVPGCDGELLPICVEHSPGDSR